MMPEIPDLIPANAPVVLYSTKSGIQIVRGPVKVRILLLLRDRELAFDEIVGASGKVKSTVSVHLRDLETLGIIGSRINPDDARKKLFFTSAVFLGLASPEEVPGPGYDTADLAHSLSGNDSPVKLYRLMFRSFRVALLQEGININPILSRAGFTIGEAVYGGICAPDIDAFLENIASFWERHSLGNVQVESLHPVIIRVTDCFECSDLPRIGKPACAFEGGILTALFTLFFGQAVIVSETECYAMGDPNCRFVIRGEKETAAG